MQLIMLSEDHSSLLTGLILSVASVIAQGLPLKPDKSLSQVHLLCVLLPIWAYIGCIAMLLVRFEELDVIQRIQAEIEELQRESARVEERREQMVSFWTHMQTLTDVWMHRTVPRLDLLKEVHGHLENVAPIDVLPLMALANARIGELEARLPALPLWRVGNGGLSEETQKGFAESLLEICREDNLESLLQGVGELTNAGFDAPEIEAETSHFGLHFGVASPSPSDVPTVSWATG